MNNKITLVYDGNKYQVVVNEEVITTADQIEEAYRCFETTIHNNKSLVEGNWEVIRAQAEKHGLEGLEVFPEYHAVQYKNIKYFHNTGKLFFTGNDDMFPLEGGYRLLLFVLERIANEQLEDMDAFIDLCMQAMVKGVSYRIKEATFTLASPIFNYGNVSYNFQTQEIHKGTHTEEGSYETFKGYVLEVIK